jgi:Cys-tRNA(Pro)/Cys-tRNA(Cys) deacylase
MPWPPPPYFIKLFGVYRAKRVASLTRDREKLENFLLSKGAGAQILVFEKSVHSVAEAAEAAGVRPDELIKTIVVSFGELGAIFIIPGEKKLSLPKARSLLGRGGIEIAKPEKVLELTGYPVGGVPPVFEKPEGIRVFIDFSLLSRKHVLGGGGDSQSLLRISPEEIILLMSPEKAELCSD